MDFILGILFGTLIGLVIFYFKKRKDKTQIIEQQSVVLLNKIRSVFKLVTVEGEFSEIYQQRDQKKYLFNLISSDKKVIVQVNAKVLIGYDLSFLKIHSDVSKRELVIDAMPQPKVLSMEQDLNYFDIKDGVFNKYNAEDLSKISKDTKAYIIEKLPESGLYNLALEQATETLMVIDNLVSTFGWKLNYDTLALPQINTNTITNSDDILLQQKTQQKE
jgi:hypothetical protein